MNDSPKPVKRLTSVKKPAPAAQAATDQAQPSGYDPNLGYDPSQLDRIPKAGAANQAGQTFLPAGTILTDFEAEGLKVLGFDPTKPIPTDLADKIAAAHEALKGPVPLPVPMDTPPLNIPKAVDVRTLPAEKQRELSGLLQSFQSAVPSNPGPGPVRPPVVNDLRPGMASTPPPPTPSPYAAAEALQQEGVDRARAAHAQGVAEGRASVEAQPQGDGGGLLVPAACPHCGFDLKKDDPTEVTSDDKLAFVQAVLGQGRFRKTYDLLGGRLKVTFRSLLVSESNMAFRQVLVDAQADLKNRMVSDTPFYWRNLTTYRTILALESVDSDSTGVVEIPAIGDIEVDADAFAFPDTKLVAVHDRIVEMAMPTEHLQSIVGHCYNEFQALCDKLTVMAEDPNFYKAIG